MAETSSLLNCRTGSRTGGSNPPPSAPRGSLREHLTGWSIHLMVRIQDSQSWHRGSIPLSTTKNKYSVGSQLTEYFLLHPVFIDKLLNPLYKREVVWVHNKILIKNF